MQSYYEQLASINVNEHVEKKNGLSYLSWTWAVDQLLRLDPEACWTYAEPKLFGETVMVFCTVRAFGKERTAHLPVMDHKHRAILTPDAFQVNTAMQRALAKGIALHGLGLYIYAGEDLPEVDKPDKTPKPVAVAKPVEPPPAVVAKPVEPVTPIRRPESKATLSPAQQAEIQRRLREVGGDLPRLLAYFRVAQLQDILAADYERVIRSLEKRRAA